MCADRRSSNDNVRLLLIQNLVTSYLDSDGALPSNSVDLDSFGEVFGGSIGQGEAGVILLVQQNRLHLRQLVVPTAGVAAGAWLRVTIPTKPDACTQHNPTSRFCLNSIASHREALQRLQVTVDVFYIERKL